jgi:hypothetical protein
LITSFPTLVHYLLSNTFVISLSSTPALVAGRNIAAGHSFTVDNSGI